MNDLISRSWLVDALESSGIANSEEDAWVHSFVMGMIADAPTVEPVRGEWKINLIQGNLIGNFKCSVCNGVGLKDSNFCPNCGARMVKDNE
jgi:hypothetical protein